MLAYISCMHLHIYADVTVNLELMSACLYYKTSGIDGKKTLFNILLQIKNTGKVKKHWKSHIIQ